VCRRDRDAALAFLRRLVYLIKRRYISAMLGRHHLRQRRRQRRLAMINVAYRAYVDMRLGSFKFLFRHQLLQTNGQSA